jgi:hypothetical protein
MEKSNPNLEKLNQNVKIINYDEIEGSTFKTKKKSFVSEINPHLVRRNIQKEQYIWFGVYDQLLRNKLLVSNLKKCKDSSFPLECAAIHLEKYQISFCKINSEVKAFLFESEGSVVFLKLYLITKEQLIDLLNIYYQINNFSNFELFKELSKADSQFDISSITDSEYNLIRCLGELDGILIYSMTTNKSFPTLKVGAPESEYLRNIYLGLKKSFNPYSEYLIMYYVYRLEGVRNYYTMNQLKECFFKSKNNSSIESKFSGMNVSNNTEDIFNVENNQLNNSSSSPHKKDNETVKCSTCNASPFVSTPEKYHLNQYAYIFDLHHLPIFDENTGEFFWSNNEANWKKARDSILKSDEMGVYNSKSISLNHGSLMSMSSSFLLGTNHNYNTINTHFNTASNNEPKNEEDCNVNTWANFKNDGASNTFIEELNNLLKDFEK